MCNFKCPFAERRKAFGFIICKGQMEEGKDYNNRNEAIKAICGYQQHCAQTGRNEVSPEGKNCYVIQLHEATPVEMEKKDAEPEKVKEESTSPKKASKKKPVEKAE